MRYSEGAELLHPGNKVRTSGRGNWFQLRQLTRASREVRIEVPFREHRCSTQGPGREARKLGRSEVRAMHETVGHVGQTGQMRQRQRGHYVEKPRKHA